MTYADKQLAIKKFIYQTNFSLWFFNKYHENKSHNNQSLIAFWNLLVKYVNLKTQTKIFEWKKTNVQNVFIDKFDLDFARIAIITYYDKDKDIDNESAVRIYQGRLLLAYFEGFFQDKPLLEWFKLTEAAKLQFDKILNNLQTPQVSLKNILLTACLNALKETDTVAEIPKICNQVFKDLVATNSYFIDWIVLFDYVNKNNKEGIIVDIQYKPYLEKIRVQFILWT